MIVLDESNNKDSTKDSLETAEELFSDPPPLYPTAGQSSSTQDKPLPRIPPPPKITSTNHLDIVRSEVPIKGTWTIDTSQSHASRSNSDSRLDVDSSSPAKPNLRLLTHQGRIEATVKVKGGRRALIEATCHSGPIILTIVGHEDTSFCARITTMQGDVLIRLPHTFCGPIKVKSRKGDNGLALNNGHARPIFSTSMQLQIVALSSIEELDSEFEESSFFLGDLSGVSSHQDGLEWSADEIHVEHDNRDRVYFFWTEETTELSSEEGGVLENILTRFKPLHEVLRRPWGSRSKRRETE